MTQPTLQIVIPFWGEPRLLYEAVESVRTQQDGRWRLTVIDDCYPDDSVAAYFAALEDDRVTYLRNEVNVGITENFRRSVTTATASHITILGCDDRLAPNYVATIFETLSSVPHADVVQPGVDVIDENGRPSRPLVDVVKQRLLAPSSPDRITVLEAQRMATSLIRGDWLYWPSLAFRTETLRRTDFRDGLAVIQDLALLMDIAFAGGTLAFNPTKAFFYRRHPESASQRTLMDGRRFRDERRYYALARKIALARGWRRTSRAARLRLTSRLHAAVVLPTVLRRGSPSGVRSTMAHMFAI